MTTAKGDPSTGSTMRRAFTIVELLITIAILTILASLAFTGIQKARDVANRRVVRCDFVKLDGALRQRKDLTGKVPADLRGLDADVRKVGRDYVDPWGTPYAYIPSGKRVIAVYVDAPAGERVYDPARGVRPYREVRNVAWQLISAGPDRKFERGGEWVGGDDLGNWRE